MHNTINSGIKSVIRAELRFEDEETRHLAKTGLRNAGFDIKIEQNEDGTESWICEIMIPAD